MAANLRALRIRDLVIFGSGALISAVIFSSITASPQPRLQAKPLGDSDVMVLAATLQTAQPTVAPGPRPTSESAESPGRLSRSSRAMSPELADRCLEVAHEVDPRLAERLERIRRERTGQAFRRTLSNAQHLVGLAKLKETDPQLYSVKVDELKVNAQVTRVLAQLVEAYRAAGTDETSGPSIGDLESELFELVRHQVGYSIVAWGMTLLRINEHVEGLKEQLGYDAGHVKETVQSKFQELLEQAKAEAAERR